MTSVRVYKYDKWTPQSVRVIKLRIDIYSNLIMFHIEKGKFCIIQSLTSMQVKQDKYITMNILPYK